MNRKKTGVCRQGNVLVMVMIAMVVLSILGLAALTVARFDAVEVMRLRDKSEAFSLAEMGLNEFRAIVTDSDNRSSFKGLGLIPDSGTNLVFDDIEVPGLGTYTVTLAHAVYSNDFFSEINGYVVTSTGRSQGGTPKSVTISSYVRTTTIAEQIWGTHTEGGVRFITGDHLWGAIHSNDKFTINGTPVIEGEARTHANGVDYQTGSRPESYVDPDVFRSGLVKNVPEISFNTSIITGMRDSAAETYPNNSVIIFNGGSYTVTSGGTTTTNLISSLGVSGDDDNIIYVNGTVTVSGEVGGSVSVVAADTIKIDGGVVYYSQRNDPDPLNWTAPPDEGESLGLFAVNKVMVTGAADDTDVNIHAAVYVPNDVGGNLCGFCVQQYLENLGPPRPYINFYGCIIQKARGVVGTGGVTGFSKNYHQDLRFLSRPPPGTPLNAPEFSAWKVVVSTEAI